MVPSFLDERRVSEASAVPEHLGEFYNRLDDISGAAQPGIYGVGLPVAVPPMALIW